MMMNNNPPWSRHSGFRRKSSVCWAQYERCWLDGSKHKSRGEVLIVILLFIERTGKQIRWDCFLCMYLFMWDQCPSCIRACRGLGIEKGYLSGTDAQPRGQRTAKEDCFMLYLFISMSANTRLSESYPASGRLLSRAQGEGRPSSTNGGKAMAWFKVMI